MRALWIEDHQLIGDSLEMLLQVVMPEISLDKARSVETALRYVSTFQYELVLLDWWLGGEDGAKAIAEIKQAGCDAPILVVSGDEREPTMRRALSVGAVGYVPKSADPRSLVDAIRNALQGRVSRPSFASAHAAAARAGSLPPLDIQAVFPDLTDRQADVFRALMRGASDKQIARELGVSDSTIKTHVRAILQVVGVHKRGEAAHEARLRGAGDS
jgi:DNA-binding NarL/FixJ family response regulator